MKTSLTRIALTALLLPLFSLMLSAQSNDGKKITITKTSVDADGSEITETIVKKGKAAENFDPEKYLRENKAGATDVDIKIEDGNDNVTYFDYETGDQRTRTYNFSFDKDLVGWTQGNGFSWGGCNDNRGFLGVEEDSDEDSDEPGLVVEVVRNSAAAKAGLKTNDIILKLNDIQTDDWDDLSDFMADTKPGDKVKITYKRGGKTETTEVTLTTNSEVSKMNCDNPQKRGYLGVGDAGDDDDDEPGVAVEVYKNSAAEKAGLQDDDVILKLDDMEINDWEDLSDFMENSEMDQKIKVTYRRDGKEKTTEATAGKQVSMSFDALNFQSKEKEACLGVYTQTSGEGDSKGAKIDNFFKSESAAREATMQEGDVITAIEGKRVKGPNELWNEIAAYKPGDKVKVSFLRDGQPKTAEATLKPCQDKNSIVNILTTPVDNDCGDDDAFLGVTVNESVGGFNRRSNDNGFIISSVVHKSAAEEAGLQPGDQVLSIGGKPTNSYGELARVMDTFKPGEKVEVVLIRDEKEQTLTVTLKSCKETNNRRSFSTWSWNSEDTERFRDRQIITIRKGEGDAQNVNVAPPTPGATDRNLKLENFRAYPNPTQGHITVEFRGEEVPTVVSLLDISGRQLFREELNAFPGEYNQQFDLSAYAKGTIIVQVMQGDKIFSEQIVVN